MTAVRNTWLKMPRLRPTAGLLEAGRYWEPPKMLMWRHATVAGLVCWPGLTGPPMAARSGCSWLSCVGTPPPPGASFGGVWLARDLAVACLSKTKYWPSFNTKDSCPLHSLRNSCNVTEHRHYISIILQV